MKKPRFPISTATKARQAREYLGLDKKAMAVALRIPGDHGRNRVRRMEDGGEIDGPMQLALEHLVEKGPTT